jgi:hypothetical protein
MRISKLYLLILIIPLVVAGLSISSCSKTGYSISSYTADSATQIIISHDELNVNYEFDQVVNEALLGTAISSIAGGDNTGLATGNVMYGTISGAIIDTSHIADSALIHITYYGKDADGTKGRTGIVTMQLSRDGAGKVIPWKTPGATMTITLEQYEVILLSNNTSVWMNGTAHLTNMTGGLLKQPANTVFPPGDSLRDMVNGNINFTYNDNLAVIVTYSWNINQVRMFNIQNSVFTSTIRGDSIINNVNGISTSGMTRSGDIFSTQITTPVVQSVSSAFILSQPLSGQKLINGVTEPIKVDYGVNRSGNPAPAAPYGYKITWTHSGGEATSVVSY